MKDAQKVELLKTGKQVPFFQSFVSEPQRDFDSCEVLALEMQELRRARSVVRRHQSLQSCNRHGWTGAQANRVGQKDRRARPTDAGLGQR